LRRHGHLTGRGAAAAQGRGAAAAQGSSPGDSSSARGQSADTSTPRHDDRLEARLRMRQAHAPRAAVAPRATVAPRAAGAHWRHAAAHPLSVAPAHRQARRWLWLADAPPLLSSAHRCSLNGSPPACVGASRRRETRARGRCGSGRCHAAHAARTSLAARRATRRRDPPRQACWRHVT